MDNWNYSYQEPPKRFITPSLVFGFASGVLLILGTLLPTVDFSYFYSDIDIQYNLFKISENIGIISSKWNVIPYGIFVAAIIMLILSFVRIPIFKILPVILATSMMILMLADVGNVVEWIEEFMTRFDISTDFEMSVLEFSKSLRVGVYFIIAGIVSGTISCFVKGE